MTLTREQRRALARVYRRHVAFPQCRMTLSDYRAFRRTVRPDIGQSVLVPVSGMWLGIEPDGYTHS